MVKEVLLHLLHLALNHLYYILDRLFVISERKLTVILLEITQGFVVICFSELTFLLCLFRYVQQKFDLLMVSASQNSVLDNRKGPAKAGPLGYSCSKQLRM